MVLIWVSLATSNVECLFMCLLVICMSSLVKCHLSLLLIFNLVKLSSYYGVARVLCIFWIQFLFIRYMIGKYFLPDSGLSFIFLMVSFEVQKFLILMMSHLSIGSCFWCHVSELSDTKSWRFSPMNSRSFIIVILTLRSMVHFEFIFRYNVRAWALFFLF